jgi:hypothetical protein
MNNGRRPCGGASAFARTIRIFLFDFAAKSLDAEQY